MSAEIPSAPEMDAAAVTWWDATKSRRLLVQRCDSCGRYQHYPRALCLGCGGTDLSFAVASGRATIHSFTVVHRAPSPAFVAPYAIALVRLAEGPLMLTRIVGSDAAGIACDAPVELRWETVAGRDLPVFALSGGG